MNSKDNIIFDEKVLDKIHTTLLGEKRIKNNIKISTDPLLFCKNKIKSKNAIIYKKGKNYYCNVDGIIITINANNYTIITAHKIK